MVDNIANLIALILVVYLIFEERNQMSPHEQKNRKIIALEELVAALQEAWDGYDPDGLVEAAEDKVEEIRHEQG